MKKTVLVLSFLGVFLLGGVTAYAMTSNYYADLLLRQQKQIEKELYDIYFEKRNHANKAVHNDMVMYVETKRQEILEEMNDYIDNKVQSGATNRLNEYTRYVDEAADQLIKELKEYIDSLENENN